jgi:hypothetical protein
MKPEYKVYDYRKYEYGWEIYSTNLEGKNEMWVYSYATEEAAKVMAQTYNENEPKRYANAVEAEKKKPIYHIDNSIDSYYRNMAYSGD